MAMYERPEIDRDSAYTYNQAHAKCVPFEEDVVDQTIQFQKKAGITVDGKWGPSTLAHWRQEHFKPACGQVDEEKIAHIISDFEGNFDSLNRDGEYRGLFGEDHFAYQSKHLGLSFGFLQFNQNAGSLGELLKNMREKDPDAFDRIFKYPDKLIEVTNRPHGEVRHQRSRRVQPVAGADLWEEPWISRFRKAGNHPPFQDVQLEYALDEYMTPAKELAKDFGLVSERAYAILFDRCIHHGPAGARGVFERQHTGQPEHLFLYDCLQAWQDDSWGHRTERLYFHEQLRDGVESEA